MVHIIRKQINVTHTYSTYPLTLFLSSLSILFIPRNQNNCSHSCNRNSMSWPPPPSLTITTATATTFASNRSCGWSPPSVPLVVVVCGCCVTFFYEVFEAWSDFSILGFFFFFFFFFWRICGLLGLLPSVGLDVLAIRCFFWRICGLSLALFNFFFFFFQILVQIFFILGVFFFLLESRTNNFFF